MVKAFNASEEEPLTKIEAQHIVCSMLVSHVQQVLVCCTDQPLVETNSYGHSFYWEKPPYRGQLIDYVYQLLVDTDPRGRSDAEKRADIVYLRVTDTNVTIHFTGA